MAAINDTGAELMSHKNKNVRRVSGRIIGTAAPGVSRVDGKGFSVSRSGAGVYVLTFDAYPKFLGGGAIVMSATLGRAVQVSAYSVSSKTITCTVIDTASKAATDLGTSDELWFGFDFGWSQRS